MTNIHRTIFLHLFWAWLLISLAGGGLLFYLEIKRVDSSIIALAVNEADTFSSQTPSLTDQLSLFEIEGWRNRALSLTQGYFVIIALYNRSREQLTEVVNPRYADIEQKMRQNHHQIPLDGRRHFEKMTVDGKIVVQVSMPIAREHMPVDGYLAGTFVIDLFRLSWKWTIEPFAVRTPKEPDCFVERASGLPKVPEVVFSSSVLEPLPVFGPVL